ncbi:MAG: hypothetical protein ACKVH5_10255, partial [Fidelibacterota bacterium]
MKKQIPLYLLVLSLFHWACEKDEPNTNDEPSSIENTLSEDLSGAQGYITDYFYNFENEIEAEFFRFDPNLMVSYESYT